MKKILAIVIAVVVVLSAGFAGAYIGRNDATLELTEEYEAIIAEYDLVVEKYEAELARYEAKLADYESLTREYESTISELSGGLTRMYNGDEYELYWENDGRTYATRKDGTGLFSRVIKASNVCVD